MLDIQQELEKYKILDPEGYPVFGSLQMQEIREGLKAGLDVSQYTILNSQGKPVYEWDQMREIRKKLEEELKTQKDISVPKEDEEISL